MSNRMKMQKFSLSAAVAISAIAFLNIGGCNPGIQGGDIPEQFTGVQSAVAISPTAAQITRSLNKKFNKYRVYLNGNSTPLKEETFQTTVVTGLSPLHTYEFSVSGVTSDGQEEGASKFTSVTTLSTFSGLQTTALAGPVAVNLKWQMTSSSIVYKIYKKVGTASWDLSQPSYTVAGSDSYQALNLQEGTQHCFFITANYADNSSEPTLDVATANAKSLCLMTTSDLQGLPTLSANAVLPGGFPWFTASGGQADMSIDIFDKATNLRVATRVGDGSFRAFAAQSPGFHEFYGLVSQTQSGTVKKARVELDIRNTDADLLSGALVRSLQESSSVIPRLISGGRGVQRLGAPMAKGDFNCDGIPDVAIAAPDATPYVDPGHASEMGAVIIYYGESYVPAGTTGVLYRLKTDVAPQIGAVAPFPQLIYYPVAYSNFHFGSKIASGNFNGDCKKFDPITPSNSSVGSCESMYATYGASANADRIADMQLIYSCDDLGVAIDPSSGTTSSNSTGGVFVMYGDPNSGLVTGSGATNYGINEPTCDPVSGTCRAGRYSHHLTSVYHFGKSLGSGDFNNDGFDDLAVGGTTLSASDYYGRVTVLRGSNQGLLPTNSAYAHAEIQAQAVSVYGTVGVNAAVPATTLNAQVSSETPDFAWAVAGVPGSRTCENITTAPTIIPFRTTTFPTDSGFDFSKCADLVVGDPSRGLQRGSIVSCKSNFSATAAQTQLTQRTITSWTCQEHYPNDLEAGAKYGFSLLGVKNQNGYPLELIPTGNKADVTGALFVGAPYAEVPDATTSAATQLGVDGGKVFGYYATPGMKGLGGIQAVIGTSPHTVQSSMAVPCDRKNESVSGRQCENQVIYNSAPQNKELFGYALGTASQSVMTPAELPKLLISAPYRTVLGDSGSISNGGAIFVYKGDVSVLGTNIQTRIESAACVGSDCNYYSGGVNPFGPSILYNKGVSAGARLGLASAVGDNFYGDASPSEVDVLAGAPDDSNPVAGNGGVSIFQASNGFSATQSLPNVTIQTNVSQEINYRFEQAKVVGDLNGDGFADVIARTKIGNSKVEVVVYYGSSNGLIITPAPALAPAGLNPKIIVSASDPLLGTKFFPIGDINGDGMNDVLFIGKSASYVYYGSLTGLVSNTEPTVSPVGKNPLKFALTNAVSDAITFHSIQLMGMATETPPKYDVSNQALAYGDFNGDGYGDFALGINSTVDLPSAVDVSGLGDPFNAAKSGRVVVIYGSPRGPQVGTGGFIRRRVNSVSTAQADVVAKTPCAPDPGNTALAKCSVQLIGSSQASAGSFGWSLSAISSMETSNAADGLVVGDPLANSADGHALYLRGSSSGLNAAQAATQLLSPPNSGGAAQFGYLLSRAGDLNKDGKEDLIISAPQASASGNGSGIYAFYGYNLAGTGQFFGAATISSSPPAQNALHSAATSPAPQWFVPSDLTTDTAAEFGYGLSSIGDFNGDGYADVIINVAKGNYQLDILKPEAGYAIIYFGSSLGLRTNIPVSTTPRCFGVNTTLEICEPFMFYLPNNTVYENTYVSNSASGDINGDGYPDVLIGGFGRNHPSGQAFSSGVFYVLY